MAMCMTVPATTDRSLRSKKSAARGLRFFVDVTPVKVLQKDLLAGIPLVFLACVKAPV
jgi:hypothetical protein